MKIMQRHLPLGAFQCRVKNCKWNSNNPSWQEADWVSEYLQSLIELSSGLPKTNPASDQYQISPYSIITQIKKEGNKNQGQEIAMTRNRYYLLQILPTSTIRKCNIVDGLNPGVSVVRVVWSSGWV